MSEANKDEATKCLKIAQNAIASGDLDKARKFGEKARQLYPSLQVCSDGLSFGVDFVQAEQ